MQYADHGLSLASFLLSSVVNEWLLSQEMSFCLFYMESESCEKQLDKSGLLFSVIDECNLEQNRIPVLDDGFILNTCRAESRATLK